MKKTLLAAALLTGFAGAASAQSSVTMYGVLDASVRYQSWNLSPVGSLVSASASTSSFAIASGALSTSRFGVKGVEDLGSGNQVVWNLESQINIHDGSNNAYSPWSRTSIVGVRNDRWGQFDIGRQLGTAFKFAGGPIDSAFNTNVPIINISGVIGVTAVRYSNMLMYQSPNMSGLKAALSYSFNTGLNSFRQAAGGNAIADTATGSSFETGNNMRAATGALSYTNGPFYGTFTYDRITPAGNTVSGANGVGVTSWIVAGSYDAKVVKVGAAYSVTSNGFVNGPALSSVSSSSTVVNAYNAGGVVFADGAKINAYNINFLIPVGASGRVMAAYQAATNAGTLSDLGYASTQNTYGLGYQYDFSKRTTGYAIYTYVNNYANITGLSGNAAYVGMRHSF